MELAEDGDTLALDNKAVVDYGHVRPHREASDMDYRLPLADKLQQKGASLRWIPGHREEAQATSPADQQDIKRNNEMDLLAKHGTRLPLEEVAPEQPHSIVLAGAEAPTPAKKWINTFRRYGKWTGCHWTTWLPMRGTRRMLWLQWLWGNIRWEGCAAPWDKSRADCSVCSDMHGQTVHKRLIQCPTWRAPFLQAWAKTWERWQTFAEVWLDSASEEDMQLVSMLRIPKSFLGTIPLKSRKWLRQRVSWHQYHMLHEVVRLRRVLPMPRRRTAQTFPSTSTSAWFGSLRARTVTPNPTPQVLAEQTLYSPKEPKRSRKRPLPTEGRSMIRLALLEKKRPASTTREAAIRMYQSVNPSWPNSGLIRMRLTRIASKPWLVGRRADLSGGIVTLAVAPRLCLSGLLSAENALIMEAAATERRELHRQSWIVLCHVHGHAKRLLKWWDKVSRRLQDSTGRTERAMEQSSRATEVLWAPLRQWMGEVHMGLHDLQMWERTWDGNVQHRVRELYLESCSEASARWRSELTRRQDAEAAARVAALHTYDAHDCLTLTGTPSHM